MAVASQAKNGKGRGGGAISWCQLWIFMMVLLDEFLKMDNWLGRRMRVSSQCWRRLSTLVSGHDSVFKHNSAKLNAHWNTKRGGGRMWNRFLFRQVYLVVANIFFWNQNFAWGCKSLKRGCVQLLGWLCEILCPVNASFHRWLLFFNILFNFIFNFRSSILMLYLTSESDPFFLFFILFTSF